MRRPASIRLHLDDKESLSLSAGELTRELFEGRWLISLDEFDSKALDFDQDVTVSKGQFFYERVSLDSCAKYLRPVRDETIGAISRIIVEVSVSILSFGPKSNSARLGLRISQARDGH
jgi:hypothetical protein